MIAVQVISIICVLSLSFYINKQDCHADLSPRYLKVLNCFFMINSN